MAPPYAFDLSRMGLDMHLFRRITAALAALLISGAAHAQSGTATSHAFAVGKGPGFTGFTSVLCGLAQIPIGQTSADPTCAALTGDVTMTAGGVTAIGSGKVTAAMIASMTSAQLRTIISDEVGTGAAYFVGGALGTPASATLTNALGLPVGGIAAMSANTIPGNATGSSAIPTALAMPSCSGATNALIWTTSTGFGCNTIAGGGGGTVGPGLPSIRLTLTQGTPVTTTDVTAATALFLEPYEGNQAAVYDGISAWSNLTVAGSTYSLPATQTQNCTANNGAASQLTSCVDTSQVVIGEQITGTCIPASTTITAILSSTSLGLSQNASCGSPTVTAVTLKFPPNTNYDVYLISASGVPKLVPSAAWSNDTTPPTRVLQDGVEVASGATTKRLVGSIRTTSVAGQLADTHVLRLVSNRYKEQPRPMYMTEPAASWAGFVSASFAWRQMNSNTSNFIAYIACVPRPIWVQSQGAGVASSNANVAMGVGIDTVSSSTAQLSQQLAMTGGANSQQGSATYTGTPGIGYHVANLLESSWTSAVVTMIGTSSPNTQISGIYGEVAN